jgi:hypothetical protein
VQRFEKKALPPLEAEPIEGRTGMRRFFMLTVAIAVLSVAMIGTASADKPEDVGAMRWTEYGHEEFDLGCSFPIVEDNEAHWMITPSGNLILQGFYTLSNPQSGKAYTGNWTETWKVTERGIQGNGLFWIVTVPGHGLVLIQAGYLLFGGPPDFPLLVERGPNTFADSSDLAAFCELMS